MGGIELIRKIEGDLGRKGWNIDKLGNVKRFGSVSATPRFPKTGNPYFLIIHPLYSKLSDNSPLALNPIDC